MAQMEQTKIYFDVASEGERAGHVDMAAVMTACNHKQFHQVSRDGTALCYSLLVTAIKGNVVFNSAPHGFPTANAVKKTSAGWKAQMRHAGIRTKDLPTYGKRARYALDRDGVVANVVFDPPELIFENSSTHLHPLQSPGGPKWFPDYTASDGTDVQYRGLATPAAGSIAANQVTQVTVTDQSVTPETSSQMPLVLLGSIANNFSVIDEWLNSRRSKESYSEETPGVQADSAMANLFSISEEQSDEVIGGVEEYMDWRPYLTDEGNKPWTNLVQLAVIDSSLTTLTTTPPIAPSVDSVVPLYPSNSAIIDVPLGLFRIFADASSSFQVDVLAIYEMS